MEPNSKLDFALGFYYNSFYDDDRKTEYEHLSDIFILHPDVYKDISRNESRLIVEKLQEDGYINVKESDPDWIKINYNGMMFHLAGGYTQYIIDLESDRTKNRLHEKVIRIGAAVAGIYAAVEILTRLYTFFASFLHFYPCCC